MSRFLMAASAAALLSTPALAQVEDDQFIDEIIVTGSPLNTTVDEAITGVSVLSGDELERNLAATIGETLKSEPGVSSTFFGAGASRPIIRGQGSDRVRVLTNGVGSIDASSASPDHAVAIEPAQAERIEVLRGAAILRYGSSGAGGVVNIIDGRIPSELPEGGTDAAFRATVTSVDEGISLAGSVDQQLGDNLVLHFDAAWREAEDYAIPGFAESARLRAEEEAEEEEHGDEEHEGEDHSGEEEVFGQLPNSFVESESYTGGLSWVGARGFFGVAVNQFESDYGIPGGHEHGHEEEHEDEDHEDEEHDEEEGEEEEEMVTIGLEQTRVDVNGALELDGVFERVQVFGGYADYTHTEFEAPGEAGTVFANEGWEVRAEAIQRESGGWAAAYGVQLRNRDFSAIGEEAFVPPTETQQYAAFTFQELDRGDWHFEAAARVELTDQEDVVNGGQRDFTALSVSGGADVHLSDAVRIGGTVYRTERAPSTEELFSNGPHLATDQFELGDPTLGKETATGADLAFRHRESGHAVTLNLFYTNYDDYIFERETDLEEDGLPVFVFTGADAEFYGFELQGELDLFETADWAVAVDGLAEYVRAETDSQNLPRIPPLSILAGVTADTGPFFARAEVDWAAEQDDTAPFERGTDGYTLVNLSGGVRLSDAVTARLGVDNLFDEDARQHASFLKDEVPLPGRNVKLSVTGRF